MTNPGNTFDCNTDIYIYFLTLIVRKKDVIPSYVKEMWMMGRIVSSNGGT